MPSALEAVERPDASAAEQSSLTPWRQWYMTGALALLLLVAAVDRMVIAYLIPGLKRDLHLSDTEIGLISGLSFILFNTATAILCGWLVDRFQRRPLLVVGCLLWSACTFASGFAASFVQLLMGRAAVGFSEGGAQPAAFSMIRDGMSPGRRGRALALIGGGTSLGAAVAAFVSGLIFRSAGSDGVLALPIVGDTADWRAVLMVVGLLGLPAALVVLPMREPARLSRDKEVGSYGEFLRYLASHWRIFAPFFGFAAVFGVVISSYSIWNVTILSRTFHLDVGEIGGLMAPILLTSVLTGVVVGGPAVDWANRMRPMAGPAYLLFVLILLSVVPIAGFAVAPNKLIAFALVWCVLAFGIGVITSLQWLLAHTVPSRMAGRAMVSLSLVQASVGVSIGPLLVGMLSDRLDFGERSLAYAHATCTITLLTVGCVLLAWFIVSLRRSIAASGGPSGVA